MEKILEVLSNRETLTQRALEVVCAKIEAAIESHQFCTLVLAGGSTPKSLYVALATQDLPWEKIHIFWGDERYVPPDHPDSNERMARLAWLDHVPIPPAQIHPMPTLSQNPAKDAAEYEVELQRFFGQSGGGFPSFDIILLGIGDDAHTASLFPQTAALTVEDRWVTVGEKDGQPRITLTVPLINHARCVLFLVAGDSKQPALTHIFSPEEDPQTYPARLIQPQGELWWLLDVAAGQNL